MVLRLVHKRALLPLSLRSSLLHFAALSVILSLLFLGLRILPLSPLPPPAPALLPDRSFVVLSVDDFGRWTDSVPLFPSSAFMRNHTALIIDNNFWYKRATVESRADLTNLRQSLHQLNRNVSFEHRAVLTPHWIVGGPDFDAMRATGCGVARSTPASSTPTPLAVAAVAAAAVSSSRRIDNPSTTPPFSRLSAVPTAADNISQTSRASAPADGRNSESLTLLQTESAEQPTDLQRRHQAESTGPDLTAVRSDPQRKGEGQSQQLLDFETCVYKEQLLSDAGPTGLDQAPYHRGDLRDSYQALWESGLWHPEYHGRSHFSVSKWLRLLRTDGKTQTCFRNNLVCATDTTQLRSEFNGFSNKAELKTWLEEGVNAFAAFWGYRPALISSPHNTWSSWLTDVAVDLSFIGAELAEDQANYVQHDNALSLHDRYRFDVFFPGFDCDRAISEVEELLRVPVEKSLSQRWYDFLSMIDLFRVHHRPYHHGSGGDHQRFISLMWHAQNAMSSTYSSGEHSEHMQCLEKVVRSVRESTPRAVFVTGSELHQIRSKGWSREIWSDSIILRNYATHAVDVPVPDLRDLYPKSKSWRGKPVIASTLSYKGQGMTASRESERGLNMQQVRVGEHIHLDPDMVVKLSRG